MNKIIYQLEQYFREILGIPVVAHLWSEGSGLPQYLRERYRFFRMDVLGADCVLMADICI